MNKTHSEMHNGEAAAVILSAGIGSAVLGILTILKASSDAIKSILSFYPPAGPLSGQTTITVAVWLASWFILHRLWKKKNLNFHKIYVIVLILIILGLVLSFPPLYEIFFESYE